NHGFDRSFLGSHFLQGTPRKPCNGGKHSQPAEDTENFGDLRVVLQQSRVRKQIIPIVDDVFRVAHRQQGKILGASVGHVDRDWQKLLEEKEHAKGRARCLAPAREIGRQSEWNEYLQQSSARHHDPFAEKSEKQMAALMNRNENEIEPLE